mmetsp:Transcript_21792/g.66144  ORF Transcript_21792/g.66144 Transcript_21792/m.66144 type:complete len:212 (+) Transcript_21792:1536-2171(+)
MLAVLLVQPILHGHAEGIKLRGGEAIDEHGRACDIKDGVLSVDFAREHGTRFRRGHLVVGDKKDALQSVRNVYALCDPVPLCVECYLKATVDCGRDIVRVALFIGRELQKQLLVCRRGDVLTAQREAGSEAGDERCRRGAHTTGRGNRVLTLEAQRRHILAERPQDLLHTLDNEVILCQLDAILALTLDDHLKLVRLLHHYAIPHIKRKPK